MEVVGCKTQSSTMSYTKRKGAKTLHTTQVYYIGVFATLCNPFNIVHLQHCAAMYGNPVAV